MKLGWVTTSRSKETLLIKPRKNEIFCQYYQNYRFFSHSKDARFYGYVKRENIISNVRVSRGTIRVCYFHDDKFTSSWKFKFLNVFARKHHSAIQTLKFPVDFAPFIFCSCNTKKNWMTKLIMCYLVLRTNQVP
jgi:hypothetical protein